MNELLSICIPTYNRSQYLLQTLEAFLPQVIPHQIPIYVSDNGSTDKTISIITILVILCSMGYIMFHEFEKWSVFKQIGL